ncbi:heat shock 70 kDa protein 12A [Pelomyxa schiedti]|nr:heat shock 70 kDa protein 12A [Pelomyxa schiedti]
MSATSPTSGQVFGVACALDIGTSCTGYCYCFADDRDRIFYNAAWEGYMQCSKTKTTLAVLASSEAVTLNVTASITKIMGMTMCHIKHRFLDELKSQGRLLTAQDVLWVITVPAIWDEPAKQVMIDAAREAGLSNSSNSNVILALEPEAASLYLVVDAGGGVINITSHEVLASGVSELAAPCGSMNGSTNIDKNILAQLYAETGSPPGTLETSVECLALSRAIEGNKEIFTQGRTMPYSFPVGKGLHKMSPASMSQCVLPVINSVVNDVRNAMAQVSGLRYIFLVGGFAKSVLLYQEMKKLEIPGELDLIRPAAPDCAVMEGALQFAFPNYP